MALNARNPRNRIPPPPFEYRPQNCSHLGNFFFRHPKVYLNHFWPAERFSNIGQEIQRKPPSRQLNLRQASIVGFSILH